MPIDDLTALGDALRAARKEKNLTQEQLADESHVSTKQIADIEKARRNPSYLILKALAKVVHLSLASCFQLFERRANGVHTLLTDGSKPSCSVIPLLWERQDHGEQTLRL